MISFARNYKLLSKRFFHLFNAPIKYVLRESIGRKIISNGKESAISVKIGNE